MMSSTETRQGFKVTKAFSVAPCNSASGLVREQHPSTRGTFIEEKEKRGMYEMRAKHKLFLVHINEEQESGMFISDTQHVY